MNTTKEPIIKLEDEEEKEIWNLIENDERISAERVNELLTLLPKSEKSYHCAKS
jgi:hypothetical protein